MGAIEDKHHIQEIGSSFYYQTINLMRMGNIEHVPMPNKWLAQLAVASVCSWSPRNKCWSERSRWTIHSGCTRRICLGSG